MAAGWRFGALRHELRNELLLLVPTAKLRMRICSITASSDTPST